MCLATTAYFNAACAVRVTIFSTGSKLWLVSNFAELHALTLFAILMRSCCITTMAKYSEARLGSHSSSWLTLASPEDCLQVPSLICDSATTPVVGGSIKSSLGTPIYDPAACTACAACATWSRHCMRFGNKINSPWTWCIVSVACHVPRIHQANLQVGMWRWGSQLPLGGFPPHPGPSPVERYGTLHPSQCQIAPS